MYMYVPSLGQIWRTCLYTHTLSRVAYYHETSPSGWDTKASLTNARFVYAKQMSYGEDWLTYDELQKDWLS